MHAVTELASVKGGATSGRVRPATDSLELPGPGLAVGGLNRCNLIDVFHIRLRS